MPQTDRVLQEAQNIMALTNVDTPLKGGENAVLPEVPDFDGTTPRASAIATPNTVLTTPYRTRDGQVTMTPSQRGPGAATPGATPIRDKLSINPEDALEATPAAGAREVRESLKMGLGSLPAPKNDFEIVVPDTEEENNVVEMEDDANTWIEDQADIDQQTEEEFRKRREAELRRRSQAVQRDFPRPLDMNHTVLRPLNSDPPLTDLQRAEELIKREMVVMLHHDCLETPTPAQMGENSKTSKKSGERAIVNEQTHR